MASITGFGGAFLRANDPDALYQWYERHVGLVKVRGILRVSGPYARRSGRLRLLQTRGCLLSSGTEGHDQSPGG